MIERLRGFRAANHLPPGIDLLRIIRDEVGDMICGIGLGVFEMQESGKKESSAKREGKQ